VCGYPVVLGKIVANWGGTHRAPQAHDGYPRSSDQ
jgi:hypothetical protein